MVEADLSAVANVARMIAQRVKGQCLVVEKSTVPVQTGQQLKRQLQLYAEKGLHCDLASDPEFLREGSAIEDFFIPTGSSLASTRKKRRHDCGISISLSCNKNSCVLYMGRHVQIRPCQHGS